MNLGTLAGSSMGFAPSGVAPLLLRVQQHAVSTSVRSAVRVVRCTSAQRVRISHRAQYSKYSGYRSEEDSLGGLFLVRNGTLLAGRPWRHINKHQ